MQDDGGQDRSVELGKAMLHPDMAIAQSLTLP